MRSLKISNNYLLRAISGLVLVAIMLFGIFGSFIWFALLAVIIFTLMLKEWVNITYPIKKDIFIGFISIFAAISSLIIVKFLKNGNEALFWYFVSIWTFDSFAMFGGKFIGGTKLAPQISPRKTWSGIFSGLYASCFAASILYQSELFWNLKDQSIFKIGSFIPTSLICLIAQGSDLFESYYKRKYSVKDSGTLIPGHGGMLDRFDSIIFSAPILLIIMMF